MKISLKYQYYRRILFGLLLFCVIPAVSVFLFSYYFYTDRIVERYAQNGVRNLEQVYITNNSIMGEMVESLRYISLDSDFIYFTKLRFYEDIVRYYRFISKLSLSVQGSPYLDSIMLYSDSFKYLDYISGRDESLFLRVGEQYSSYCQSDYYYRFFYRKDPFNGNSYISYIIPSFINGSQGETLLIVNMKVNTLVDETGKISDGYRRSIYMEIGDEILPLIEDAGVFNPFVITGEKLSKSWQILNHDIGKIVATFVSDSNGYISYYSFIEEKEYVSDLRHISYIYFFIQIIFLLLAAIIALNYSRFLYTPIENLLFSIMPENETKKTGVNEFQLILHRYSGVLENNKNLQAIIDANKIIMRDKFLNNLLKGHFRNEAAVVTNMKEYGITFHEKLFVLSIYFEKQNEFSENEWVKWQEIKSGLFKVAESILSENTEFKGLTCELPNEELVMIISISSGMPDNSLQAFIEDYVLKLDTLINDKIHLGISERGDKPLVLNQLFQQSRQALQIGLLRQHSRVHYYEDVAPRSGVSINYSTIINRFGELSAANDREQIPVFVDEITDTAQNEFRTYQNGINYYVKIVSHIIDYLEEKYAIALELFLKENPYQQIWNCKTFGEMEDFLTVFFTSAMEVVQQHLTDISGTGIKVRKTIQFINENYTDKNLNLAGVADIVKVNPSYLSRIFSREMGIPFQDYLTRIRVRRAKEKIINTDIPFYSISESVGFGSVLSFNRSFKKIEGANPKDYRKDR